MKRSSFANLLNIDIFSDLDKRNDRSGRRRVGSRVKSESNVRLSIIAELNKVLHTIYHSVIVTCFCIVLLSSSKFLLKLGLKICACKEFFDLANIIRKKFYLMGKVRVMGHFFSDMADEHVLEFFKGYLSIHLSLIVVNCCSWMDAYIHVVAFQMSERKRIPHMVLESIVHVLWELFLSLFEIVITDHLFLQFRHLSLVKELLNLFVLKHSHSVFLVFFWRGVLSDDSVWVFNTCSGRYFRRSDLLHIVDRSLHPFKLNIRVMNLLQIWDKHLFCESWGLISFFTCKQMFKSTNKSQIRFHHHKP